MPAYEYVCRDCGQEFTAFLTLQEFDTHPKLKCPHCGSDYVERHYGAFYAKTSKKS